MKKIIILIVLFFSLLEVNAQVNGAPSLTLGPDLVIPCNQNCATLTANLLQVGSTTSYAVSAIPHSPLLPYNAPLGNPANFSSDDGWSNVINLPFSFCFYGSTYNQLKLGANGAIKFGPSPLTNGGNHPWSFNSSVPSPNLVNAGNIFGPYHDLAPSLFQGIIPGLLVGSVNWFITGTAPNRQFVVNYNNTPHYICLNISTTSQIVLHENSNIIDIFVNSKARCNVWNGGRAVIGIQNNTGTAGVTPPNRNTGSYNISTPEAWRFSPSGPSSYSTVQWLENGAVVGTGPTFSACPSPSDTYVARTTFTNCIGQNFVIDDTVQVSFDEVDVFVNPVSAFICSGQSVSLSASSPQATSYVWNPGALPGQTVSVTPGGSTVYTVTATNAANGCSATASSNVAISTPQPNVCNLLYVTPTGSPSGSGSKSSPMDLQTAMNVGSCIGTTIKLAVGTYTSDTNIISVTSYLTLEGGFDPANNWEKTSTPGATTIVRTANNVVDAAGTAPRIAAFEISGQTGFRFQDLTIEVADAPPAAPGNSGITAYGILINSCDAYQIVRTQVFAGNGSDGGSGLPGNAGAAGPNGGSACGRPAGIGGGNGGNGGNGGTSSGCSPCLFGNCAGPCDGSNGSAGGNGGGAGGNGGNRGVTCAAFGVFSGQHGTAGLNGGNGVSGGNGTIGGLPTFTQYFLPGTPGTNGINGTIGAGGGGAGGSGGATGTTGGGGGGGGGGGAGGEGGQGGKGGGGSFAVYIANNGAGSNLIDNDFFNENPGNGGMGGPGGTGGAGGQGGNSSTNPCSGCQNFNNGGGDGGTGGNGGMGGNGRPGSAAAVYVNGTLPTLTINGSAQALSAGMNNPTNFNLIAQSIITMEDVSCTETSLNFSAAASSNWDFDAISTPPTATGASVLTEYANIGRKDIDYGTEQYNGFANIILDISLLPTFNTSAPLVNGVYTVCSGETVSFNATNAGLNYIYNWDLGGGATPNTYSGLNISAITATFNTPGLYTIQLQYETNCCGLTLPGTIQLRVVETPSVSMPADVEFCQGVFGGVTLEIAYTPANASILWSPSAGLSNINLDSISALPNATTTYTATITDSTGLCSASGQVTVNVIDLQLNTITTDATCAVLGSAEVQVTGGSGNYSYVWDGVSAGSLISGLQADDYLVVVTDINNGCADSTFAVVNAGPNTLVGIANIDNQACAGSNDGSIVANAVDGTAPYTYDWGSLGVVNTTPNTSDIQNNLAPGNYTVSITDANGCLYVINAEILAADSIIFSVDSTDASTCFGLEDGYISVKNDGGVRPYSYSWNNGLPVVLDNDNVIASNLAPGIYTLTVTDSLGCQDSITFDFDLPAIIPTEVDTAICLGTEVSFLNETFEVLLDTVLTDTTYFADGCIDSITVITIDALDVPIANLTAVPDTIFFLQSSTLNATGGYTYNWLPASNENTNSISVNPSETTTYNLVITNDDGCSEELSVTVYVIQGDVDLMVPTAFSPNNDGVNDVFRVVNPDFFENIEMNIYNRWGELIHSGSGFNHGWDGFYKGVDQAIDTYVYYIKANSVYSGNKIEVTGNVTLIK